MTELDDLVVRNMKLVPYTINKMGLESRLDDLTDVGWIGLMKGAKGYRQELGKESTYLMIAIKNEIIRELNKEYSRSNPDGTYDKMLSLDYQIEVDTTLLDLLPSKYNIDDELDFHILRNIIVLCLKDDNLSNRNKQLLIDYFGLNGYKVKQVDLAKRYNLSKTRISQIVNRFKKRLAKELAMDYEQC